MASGRMLQKKISLNRDIPALIDLVESRLPGHGAYAALVYTWCIAHLDCEGRMHGDPEVIKGTVATRLRTNSGAVAEYLRSMDEVGLIRWYEAEGDQWIEMPGFEGCQPGLRKDKEAPSHCPSSSVGTQVRTNSGLTPEQVRTNSRPTPSEEKRREEKPEPEGEARPGARLDFDSLYALYPHKEGRKKGLEHCRTRVKSQAQYDRLRQAILTYASKTHGQDAKYIKHFDTFMNCWEDYAPPNGQGTLQLVPEAPAAPNAAKALAQAARQREAAEAAASGDGK